ncbi:hypothetical protein BH11PAT1_BH11PAT1_7720 [soil metagenome]
MDRKKPLTYEEFEYIYKRVPRLCVEVIVVNEQGVLLTLRKEQAWKGQWHIPGGTVYLRESMETAVKRVAHEELGIGVDIQEFLGFIEYFSEEKVRGFGYSIGLAFLCYPLPGDIVVNDQADKAQYFLEVPENTITEQKEMLEHVLSQDY